MTPKTNTRTWKSRWRVLSSGGLCTRRSICFTRLTYGSRGRSEGWDWWSSPAWCVQRRRRSATPSGSESHRWSCFLTSIRKTWLRIYIFANVPFRVCFYIHRKNTKCSWTKAGVFVCAQRGLTRPLSSHIDQLYRNVSILGPCGVLCAHLRPWLRSSAQSGKVFLFVKHQSGRKHPRKEKTVGLKSELDSNKTKHYRLYSRLHPNTE